LTRRTSDRGSHPWTGDERLHTIEHLDGHVRFEADNQALDPTMRHIAPFGINSLVSRPPTLEDLFLRHYSDEMAQARA
jgi:ABC-2 type transport system ATP-binding protein